MSRLRFVFALAALVALAIALAACGSGSSSNSSKSPEAVVQSATLAGIESGEIDLSLDVNASGQEGGNLKVSLSGPFQSEGKGQNPQFDLNATAKGSIGGKDVDFDGGLVLLPNSAYVNYEGTEYEVDPTTFSFVESALNQAQHQGNGEGESSGATACQEAASNLDLASFADNLKNEGSADVGGTATTKLSGDLDLSGAIDALVKLSEDPSCSAQLNATGAFPSPDELAKAKDEVKSAVKAAHVELYVGDDNIVRRIVAQLEIAPKASSGGPSKVRVDLDLTLTGVNEEQDISAPSGAKPLNDLFLKLGVNPLELASALQGGEGLNGLLEGLGGAAGGGASAGGGGASSPGGKVQSYTECVQGAASAADLQKCAEQL